MGETFRTLKRRSVIGDANVHALFKLLGGIAPENPAMLISMGNIYKGLISNKAKYPFMAAAEGQARLSHAMMYLVQAVPTSHYTDLDSKKPSSGANNNNAPK